MIHQEDISEFNDLTKKLNDLAGRIRTYNPAAKICFNVICDLHEEDECCLFLLDNDNGSVDSSYGVIDSAPNYSEWVRTSIVAGRTIKNSELFSRNDIAVLIKEFEEPPVS